MNTEINNTVRPLASWTCHKQVEAEKITQITTLPNGKTELHFGADNSGPFAVVDAEWLARHNPQIGGYFVLYKDGYSSYSPAEAFEEGYSRDTSDTSAE